MTPTTLFQAASISKPVAAIGALRLVELGRLQLDEDVNARLTTWCIPASPLTVGPARDLAAAAEPFGRSDRPRF